MALTVREPQMRRMTHDALVNRRDLRDALGVGILAEHDRAVCRVSEAATVLSAQSRALRVMSASVSQ